MTLPRLESFRSSVSECIRSLILSGTLLVASDTRVCLDAAYFITVDRSFFFFLPLSVSSIFSSCGELVSKYFFFFLLLYARDIYIRVFKRRLGMLSIVCMNCRFRKSNFNYILFEISRICLKQLLNIRYKCSVSVR